MNLPFGGYLTKFFGQHLVNKLQFTPPYLTGIHWVYFDIKF
jgi:hypothetical protein